MLFTVGNSLAGIADYARRHLSKEESHSFARQVAKSMADTFEISQALHRAHPDILPEELTPGSKLAKAAGRRRAKSSPKHPKRGAKRRKD
jgi:hypothetical protein